MGTETIESTQAPWGPLQPYLQSGFQRAENLYQTGGPQYFPGSTVAQFGDTTNQALGAYKNIATAGNPITQPTQNMLAGTLNGDYLHPESNPYLQGMFDDAASAVTRQYREAVAPSIQAQFAASGRTGSGLYANAMDSSRDTLSRNLGGMASNIFGGNYQNERNRQLQAASLAPQTAQMSYLDANQLLNVGELEDTKSQQNITDDFNRYMFDQERPFDNLARYQGFLGGNYGSQNSQEQYTPSGWQTGLGIGLTGLGVLNDVGGLSGLKGLLGL